MKKALTWLVIWTAILIIQPVYSYYCALMRPDVQSYIQSLVHKYDFDQEKLERLFCTVTLNEEVIARVKKPAEAKPWFEYRKIFITADRINKGVVYWQQHEKALADAEQKYGVPASVIIAIIGVETKYGENAGTFPIFNTLVTLSFNNGHRADFFRSELTQYLLLARENHFAPTQLKGSYAGAMGLPQFMPSSYREYAVDSQGKGYVDLFHNDDDAISSVANYLHRHGWKTGEPIAISAKVDGDACLALIDKKYAPHWTASDLANHQVTPDAPLTSKACLIRLAEPEGFDYWLGLKNFQVISTYNKSELYVMAVRELAKKIREQRNGKEIVAAIEPPALYEVSEEGS